MDKQKYAIVFSTADWDAPYWTNKQHTTVQLVKEGYKVLYIESIGLRTPKLYSGVDLFRMARRLKRSIKGTRNVREGIWVLSPPVIPFLHDSVVVHAFNKIVLEIFIRRFISRHRFKKPLIWTYHPFMLSVIREMETGPIVYHCVDDLSAVPGIDSKAFQKEEQKLLATANIVFTTSMVLFEKCSRFNNNVYNFPNVVDVELFEKNSQDRPLPVDLVSIPEPRIGYVGALSDYKVDFFLLVDIAKQKPNWHFVLIGEEAEGQVNALVKQLRKMQNVHFLGHRPYQLLPDYLRGLNVGLLPSLINDYTRGMFPMKYFEYLAARIPIVSTPLDFTRFHRDGLIVAEGAGLFIQAIESQLKRGRLSSEEARSFIGDNTWDERLKKMLKLVEQVK